MDTSFEMEGRVVELLRGCGAAVIAGERLEVSLHRGTDGVEFEALVLGQKVVCTVTGRNRRVVFARQQPMAVNVTARDSDGMPTAPRTNKGS